MASNMIEELREKFRKIKAIKTKAKGKLTAETLQSYPGFEDLTLEKREVITQTLNELARIVLIHMSNIKRRGR